MAAQIIAWLESKPTARMAQRAIISNGQLLQLRPTVDFPPAKARGLQGFHLTVVVEVAKLGLPSPATARHPQ